jgi:two-component system phosphoglycerate transport system sensor histidine kinase PgtB
MVKNKMPDTMRDYVSAQKALVEASRPEKPRWGASGRCLKPSLAAVISKCRCLISVWRRLSGQRRVDSGGDAAGAAAGVGAESLFYSLAAGETLYRAESGGGADWFRPDGCDHSGLWRDELGRIAGLLRHTLGQLNAQKQQLEQEIGERKAIEADLRATQDELIQTAKLAVVGQTMTTLAHEINQPLNALSMYLFTAGRAIEQGQTEQARTTLSKAEGLINRIDAIIRSLRQFTRRAELETPLHPVDLRQTFTVAWELLAMRHKPQQGTLVIPDETVWIRGDEVRVHQVLVNVLSNALDACPHAAQITVSWQIQGDRLCVLIADNGPAGLRPYSFAVKAVHYQ